MSPATVAPRRLPALDGLRFLAAFAVLAYHYTAYGTKVWDKPTSELFPFLGQVTAYGALGVQLFFVISGFVIVKSIAQRTALEFAASRVARLFPAYWASVVLAATLIFVIAPGRFPGHSLSEVPVNLTMMQTAFGVHNLDGVYWTLWIELLFYLLAAVVLIGRATQQRIAGFILLWPLLGQVMERVDFAPSDVLLNPAWAPLFCGGMALFLVYEYGHSLARWLLVAYSYCMALPFSVEWVNTKLAENTGVETSPTVGAVLLALIIVAVAVCTVSPLAGRGPRLFVRAGALTYPLYLVRELWGWWLIHLLGDHLNRWLVVLTCTVFALLLAWLIERFIEPPLGKVLQKSVKALSKNGPSPVHATTAEAHPIRPSVLITDR